MHSHFCKYYGLNIDLQSNSQSLYRTAMDMLLGFSQTETAQLGTDTIVIKLFEGKPTNKSLPYTISSMASASANSLVITDLYLQSRTTVEYVFTENDLSSISIHFEKSALLSGATLLLNSALLSQHLRNMYIKYVEQALNWHLLQSNGKLDCLHAAGAAHTGKAYIFTGQNGVGKSTVVQNLLRNSDWQFIGDNYIFCNETGAVVSRDRLRLDTSAISHGTAVQESEFGFGKSYVKTPKQSLATQLAYPLDSIYIVRRSNSWKKTALSAKSALELIHLQQVISGDECAVAPIAQFQLLNKNVRITKTLPKCNYYLLEIGPIDTFVESILT